MLLRNNNGLFSDTDSASARNAGEQAGREKEEAASSDL